MGAAGLFSGRPHIFDVRGRIPECTTSLNRNRASGEKEFTDALRNSRGIEAQRTSRTASGPWPFLRGKVAEESAVI